MPVNSDNLNLNLNLNLGTSAAGNATGFGRPRFNTEDYAKLAPANIPAHWPRRIPTYGEFWDPDLLAWRYVLEFISTNVWSGVTPIAKIGQEIFAQTGFPVPETGAGLALNAAGLKLQVEAVVNSALDRADRAMEIMDQASAAGALNYWTGMLHIDPVKDKYAWLLMLVGRKIGEFVAMGLKDRWRLRRPSQIYPLIVPVIDAPDTPSYPSSHAVQAYLISGLLKLALHASATQTQGALDHLARRVAENREIGGVHFPMDSAAGKYAAERCLVYIAAIRASGTTLIGTLIQAAHDNDLQDLP